MNEGENVGGRGKKQCKGCGIFLGVRTQECSCGYKFSKSIAAVKAPSAPMIVSTKDNVTEVIGSAKSILSSIQSRSDRSVTDWKDSEKKVEKVNYPEAIGSSTPNFSGKRNTYVMSGDCPYKPEGFRSIKWEDGPASDEVVKNWAIKVFNSSLDLHPDAIIYWARYYWNIHNVAEWDRIKDLILSALTPKGSNKIESEWN